MSAEDRAARLKIARQGAGFSTAAAAAAKFDWNRNTYTSNENGNATYSYARAKEYAEAFGVGSDWLYDGIDTTDPDAVPPKSPALGREFASPVRDFPQAVWQVPALGGRTLCSKAGTR